MSYKIEALPPFAKEVKYLAKRYKSLKEDILRLRDELDGAVSGMPAIRETGPGKNLLAVTVSTLPHKPDSTANTSSPNCPLPYFLLTRNLSLSSLITIFLLTKFMVKVA